MGLAVNAREVVQNDGKQFDGLQRSAKAKIGGTGEMVIWRGRRSSVCCFYTISPWLVWRERKTQNRWSKQAAGGHACCTAEHMAMPRSHVQHSPEDT